MAQNLSINDVDTPPKLENECLENNNVHCFTVSISKFVNRNMDINKLRKSKVTGKAYVQFTITKEGEVVNARARSKSDILAEVVTEAIQKLPIAEVAIMDGQPVEISYTLPISFNTLSIDKKEVVYEGNSTNSDFTNLTEATHAPKFQNYERAVEAIETKLKADLRLQLQKMNFKDEDINKLKVTFVITRDAKMKNILAITSNTRLRNNVKRLLDKLTILEPGLDDENKPMDLRVIYNFEKS